jgi:hypothetical protein
MVKPSFSMVKPSLLLVEPPFFIVNRPPQIQWEQESSVRQATFEAAQTQDVIQRSGDAGQIQDAIENPVVNIEKTMDLVVWEPWNFMTFHSVGNSKPN